MFSNKVRINFGQFQRLKSTSRSRLVITNSITKNDCKNTKFLMKTDLGYRKSSSLVTYSEIAWKSLMTFSLPCNCVIIRRWFAVNNDWITWMQVWSGWFQFHIWGRRNMWLRRYFFGTKRMVHEFISNNWLETALAFQRRLKKLTPICALELNIQAREIKII